jgi:hypothetical protein
MKTLRGLMAFSLTEGLIDTDPTVGVKLARVKDIHPRKARFSQAAGPQGPCSQLPSAHDTVKWPDAISAVFACGGLAVGTIEQSDTGTDPRLF